MGTSCRYFSKEGIWLSDITGYLINRFGNNLKDDFTTEKILSTDENKTLYGNLRFVDDTNQKRRLFIEIPGFSSTPTKGIPVDFIADKSLFLTGAGNEFYINLLTDIAKTFGGYLCTDDKAEDEDDPIDWIYIEPSVNKDAPTSDPVEGKVFNLYNKYTKKMEKAYGKNIQKNIMFNYVIGFIKENLDELKKL